ncbi:hypothetical protein BASA83_013762 [Batrachochytrium salamandrivorans]|nr:hypothetical protein BASA83_013762 [Batrachochytrium salamandrivorans]
MKVAVALIYAMVTAPMAMAWGREAHVVIGEVATHFLSPRGLRLVRQLIPGKTLAGVSLWADGVKMAKQYSFTRDFHYIKTKDNPPRKCSFDDNGTVKMTRCGKEDLCVVSSEQPLNTPYNVNYRSRIFSAVVMGKAYYGLELVGGNKSHLAPLQKTINKGIRLFTGARLSTAIGPLLVETGIGSLLTRSLVSRVRLLERSVTKRTPINALLWYRHDVYTECLRAVGKIPALVLVSSDQTAIQKRYWLTPQVRPKTVKQRHSFA